MIMKTQSIIGMCEGLGLGTNAMSALVTRGCGEMRRLGIKLGAQPSTIAGLSGKWRSSKTKTKQKRQRKTIIWWYRTHVIFDQYYKKKLNGLEFHASYVISLFPNIVIGVGDTFGTCFGPLSRNRKFGYRLGKGETMQEILASTTEVAEGVDTAIALVNFIKTNVKGYRMDLKFPILFGVAAILQGTLTPLEGLKGIMNMPFLMENYDER
jgi:glycerol-3-phosphate dehydrogenase